MTEWPSLRVAFRVDASVRFGTGHVMRCLALADTATARGGRAQFVSRAHEGNLTSQAYDPRPYPQRRTPEFVSHLSIVDVIAHLGWDGARRYVAGAPE